MINAGLTYKQKFTLTEYSADAGYTLRGRLFNQTGDHELPASWFTGSGSNWTLKIPKSETILYTPGTFSLHVVAVNNDEELLAHNTQVTVQGSGKVDGRSRAQRTLDALNARLEGKAGEDMSDMTISLPDGSSRSITRLSWDDLLKAKNHYQRIVNRENGRSGFRRHQMRFTND